jgi:hypothetical protein
MSDRPVSDYVWRLVVEYPPSEPWPRGGVPGNAASYEFAEANDGNFWWPRHTRYLTKQTAEKRADLLRKYGATVTVVRSEPIVWPGGDRHE